jgi:hypothetical protein
LFIYYKGCAALIKKFPTDSVRTPWAVWVLDLVIKFILILVYSQLRLFVDLEVDIKNSLVSRWPL